MELHLAIKNLVKYKNTDFINEPQFINALIDFNAFENFPSLKNITRILLSDGYGRKIMSMTSWNMQAQTLVSDISRDYSFDEILVEYVLKSIAYGIDIINDVQVPSLNGSHNQNSSGQQASNSSNSNSGNINLNLKPSQLEQLDDDKKYDYKIAAEKYIDSVIEIRGNWEKELGAKYNIYSQYDSDEGNIEFYIEKEGKIKKDYIEYHVVLYNEGKIIAKEYNNSCDSNRKTHEVSQILINVRNFKIVSNISKVIVFWSE